METKTETAVKLFKARDIKGALRIFKTFKLGLTRDERTTLSRGYEALVHPDFFLQLKQNPQHLVADSCILIQRKFIAA